MEIIKEVSQFFVLAIGLGTLFCTPIADSSLTGAGFQRLIQTMVLGSLIISFSLYFFSPYFEWGLVVVIYVLALVLSALVHKFHGDQKTRWMWMAYYCQVILFLVLGQIFHHEDPQLFTHFFMTALLAGATNYAMILGHYYLVVPKLSERPLLITLQLLWIAMLLKLSMTGKGLYENLSFFQEGSDEGLGYMFNWIMVSMRVLWGYVALFVLSLFAWKLCRIRSIQSATGLFYVMVFFVIIGELVSAYLFFGYGLYL
ncbi:MAG: hypothetical protein JNM93_01355 [Bacteriovoracaceae bacterium]|nr:hypothetical protein [Bacteriovoracaceae bacterium]